MTATRPEQPDAQDQPAQPDRQQTGAAPALGLTPLITLEGEEHPPVCRPDGTCE